MALHHHKFHDYGRRGASEMEQERKAAASTELSLEISFEDKFYF